MSSPNDNNVGGKEKFSKTFRDVGPFFGSGIQLAAAVVIMYFIGLWIDSMWETEPWGMIVCVFFGSAAGLVHFIREVMAYNDKESKQQKK
ncbi:MAG: AtpZ/AtpI family protein [Bacteroidetes bacterium]|nr:MAG: AtpZ/AtpI family protein [Bacteroidota bacterium]